MSTATYLQRGESWDYRNTGTAPILPGTIVPLADRIGIVGGGGVGPLLPGNVGIVETVGIWDMPKAEGEAVPQGTVVYYDEENECVTAKATPLVAGRCAWAAGADDPVIEVDIKAAAMGAGAPVAGGGD